MSTSAVLQTGSQAVQEYNDVWKTEKTQQANYGKTIGKPELSQEAQKYYEQLKKKYSNMDFILVSEDMKAVAQANAGSYGNANRMVVLIDEDKIERMATDEKYRKQYEGIISNATFKMQQLKKSLASSGSNVKSFGMSVKDGLTSMFAVLEKGNADQKKRLEKKAAKKLEERKKAKRKADKERLKELQEGSKTDRTEQESSEKVVTGDSIEDLLRKLETARMEEMSDLAWTDEERMLGTHIDFRG